MEPETIVECKDLMKTYRMGFFLRRRQVLGGVTFDVRRGEIFGFLGPNGAGKTTTMKVLLGLARMDGGIARLFGQPAGKAAVRQRLGFVADNAYFYDQLNGLQTLALAGRMYNLSGKDIRRRSEELLERVGLARSAWKIAVRKYSRGMLQRLGLAQALIGNPELLMCDEPMEGLDPIGRHEVRELLRSLRAEGRTILVSTHILSDVEVLCDRAAIIVEGRVHRTGLLADVIQPKVLGCELALSGMPPELLEKARKDAVWVREDPNGVVHLRFSSAETGQSLARESVSRGGQLRSLTPLRESFDDFFYRFVKESAPHD